MSSRRELSFERRHRLNADVSKDVIEVVLHWVHWSRVKTDVRLFTKADIPKHFGADEFRWLGSAVRKSEDLLSVANGSSG